MILGLIGSLLLAFCALPQAWQAYREKSSRGVNWAFLLMWFWGEVFTFIYVAEYIGADPVLMLNYTLNLAFLLVIIFYKIVDTKQ